MNRSRTFILLGVVLLLGAVAVLVLGPQLSPPSPAPAEATTAPKIPTTQIIVAAQNIPRGTIIGKDAVIPNELPNANLPPNDLLIFDPELVIGKRARTDIFRGQPVLQTMITEDPSQLASIGNDAALFIPPGKVAVPFPIDQITSVGYAIGDGDHVDMLISFSIVDANQEGQYPVVPFNRDFLDELTSVGVASDKAVDIVLAQQDKAQPEPRLLTQLTLQNIEVLHVGEWPADGSLPRPMPTLSPEQAASAPPPAPGGTATPVPPRPNIMLLLVDHQQALILQWLRQSGMTISVALRGAGDNAPVSTDTVSYQYILTSFNITVPPKVNTLYVTQPKSTTP
jgi:pilus assembly protein CpaB